MFRLILQAATIVWLALIASGCGLMWEGDWEQDGDRRIYFYEVEPGDTLRAIAWRYGLRVEQLVSWNEIENPDMIRVGQKLVLNPPGDARNARRPHQSSAEEPTTQPPPPPQGKPKQEHDWQWPTQGEVIRDYATDSGGKSGIQIGGEKGQVIRAASSGEIVYSGSGLRGYGKLIIIMHDANYVSAYGYNSKLLAAEGEQVSQGERIAAMGYASGSDQASLHFEIRIDGQAVDPEDYLPARE